MSRSKGSSKGKISYSTYEKMPLSLLASHLIASAWACSKPSHATLRLLPLAQSEGVTSPSCQKGLAEEEASKLEEPAPPDLLPRRLEAAKVGPS